MAEAQVGRNDQGVPKRHQQVPPGATRKAMEEIPLPGNGPPPSDLGDRHASGTPAGGTEVGGLGGTNVNEGSPTNADLEEAHGTGIEEHNAQDGMPPYGGHAGGAVGGTPAEGRSSGGNVHGGIRPRGVHRGDSTIGTDPESGTE